ncbi:MAG TPA: GNAT family N-acetyltransferase [Rhizomicrobium sp.]|nr:GNAT family N-acetyltransferase [Rhizomicrobium sp.]
MQIQSNEFSAQRNESDRAEYVSLRSALREGDAEAVARLVAHTGVFNAEEVAVARSLIEETRAHDKGEYLFLMADGTDGLDGYVCFGPIPGTERRYELYWIAVQARHRGLGRKLLAACERAIRQCCGTHLFAETSTREEYAPAHALYRSSGYRLEATVADYHADGDHMAIFAKRL